MARCQLLVLPRPLKGVVFELRDLRAPSDRREGAWRRVLWACEVAALKERFGSVASFYGAVTELDVVSRRVLPTPGAAASVPEFAVVSRSVSGV